MVWVVGALGVFHGELAGGGEGGGRGAEIPGPPPSPLPPTSAKEGDIGRGKGEWPDCKTPPPRGTLSPTPVHPTHPLQYKKVPIVKLDGEVVNDSSAIISRLSAEMDSRGTGSGGAAPSSDSSSGW